VSATDPQLLRYLDELYLWNRRIHLTTVPREQALERHVGEARRLLLAADPPAGARVVDIGSGGGVPGLVIAILRPDLHVLLVDSDRRSAGFLTHAAAICGCPGVRVVAGRAEELGHEPAHRAGYDLAVSRAAAAPPVLCELALPLLRVGGRLLALVGDAEAAIASCLVASSSCGGGAPSVAAPGILAVSKLSPTPDALPRRVGLPARRPLGRDPTAPS
jgi:16S rRNA (guanine527-N7)-methyltransferase